MGTWVHRGYSSTTCMRVRILWNELYAGTAYRARAVCSMRVRLRVQEGLAEQPLAARRGVAGGVLITFYTRFLLTGGRVLPRGLHISSVFRRCTSEQLAALI